MKYISCCKQSSGEFAERANFFYNEEALILGSTINGELLCFYKDTVSFNVFPGCIPVYGGTMPMVPITDEQLNGCV